MITKAEFEKVLDVESEGLKFYNNVLSQLKESPVKDKIREIRNDEEKHVRIAERMLELINGQSTI